MVLEVVLLDSSLSYRPLYVSAYQNTRTPPTAYHNQRTFAGGVIAQGPIPSQFLLDCSAESK